MVKKAAIPEDCMPQCKSCAFFAKEPKQEVGECHASPRVMVPAPEDEGGFGFIFPPHHDRDWCRLFQRKTN